MKRLAVSVAALTVFGILASVLTAKVQQPAALNPVGSYSVSSATDTGDPMSGTLVITASDNGYSGRFTSPVLPEAIPVLNVATNSRQMMATLNTGESLAFVWVEFAADGTFKGTWHELLPGIAANGKKDR
jgi:hypothetical protein